MRNDLYVGPSCCVPTGVNARARACVLLCACVRVFVRVFFSVPVCVCSCPCVCSSRCLCGRVLLECSANIFLPLSFYVYNTASEVFRELVACSDFCAPA